MQIKYIKGDLFKKIPEKRPNRIVIPHVCNNICKWNKGFAVPLGENFPEAKEAYRQWFNNKIDLFSGKRFCMGETQFVLTQKDNIIIANMVAQSGTISLLNERPLCYASLGLCLNTIRYYCIAIGAEVYAPKIGSGLGGGDWSIIEKLIHDNLVRYTVPVTIFELD